MSKRLKELENYVELLEKRISLLEEYSPYDIQLGGLVEINYLISSNLGLVYESNGSKSVAIFKELPYHVEIRDKDDMFKEDLEEEYFNEVRWEEVDFNPYTIYQPNVSAIQVFLNQAKRLVMYAWMEEGIASEMAKIKWDKVIPTGQYSVKYNNVGYTSIRKLLAEYTNFNTLGKLTKDKMYEEGSKKVSKNKQGILRSQKLQGKEMPLMTTKDCEIVEVIESVSRGRTAYNFIIDYKGNQYNSFGISYLLYTITDINRQWLKKQILNCMDKSEYEDSSLKVQVENRRDNFGADGKVTKTKRGKLNNTYSKNTKPAPTKEPQPKPEPKPEPVVYKIPKMIKYEGYKVPIKIMMGKTGLGDIVSSYIEKKYGIDYYHPDNDAIAKGIIEKYRWTIDR